MIKSILSLISFIGMTVLAYYTVRTFAFVTSVFAILAIITMVSAVLVGKSGKLMNFLFEDLEDNIASFRKTDERKYNGKILTFFTK